MKNDTAPATASNRETAEKIAGRLSWQLYHIGDAPCHVYGTRVRGTKIAADIDLKELIDAIAAALSANDERHRKAWEALEKITQDGLCYCSPKTPSYICAGCIARAALAHRPAGEQTMRPEMLALAAHDLLAIVAAKDKEIAGLRTQLEVADATGRGLVKSCDIHVAEIAALRAEVERLNAELGGETVRAAAFEGQRNRLKEDNTQIMADRDRWKREAMAWREHFRDKPELTNLDAKFSEAHRTKAEVDAARAANPPPADQGAGKGVGG